MNAKKNNHTCKTCIYREYWCLTDDDDTCDEWEGPDDEPDLTDEEKADIKGDMEAHRIMVEGRGIEGRKYQKYKLLLVVVGVLIEKNFLIIKQNQIKTDVLKRKG